MKILIVHSYYQVRGGEDNVFEQEYDLLSQHHEVEKLTFKNRNGWIGAILFFLSLWNVFASKKVRNVINSFKPDVVHIHNLHYATGPIIIRTIKKLGVPIVITLHNYRILCPSGFLMKNGKLFTDSVYSSFPWKAIKDKVFRNSHIMTFWLVFVNWSHRMIGTWKLVDQFIVLTEFNKNIYLSSTLNITYSNFTVKPNFFVQNTCGKAVREPYFLYIGRLGAEKGIEVLLNAFTNSSFRLKIAGDGPFKDHVLKLISINKNIEYLGPLDKPSVLQEMQRCSALVFPSICYEGMPMVILEAFSMGTPVIASDYGALSSIIQCGINGTHFEVNNSHSLKNALIQWSDLTNLEKDAYSNRAYRTYEENYTSEANYKMLMNIYKSVIDREKETKQDLALAL